ncbi:hypothetical protein HC031_11130 [Planosporangium thailandense]|uniref:Glycosyl transferase n=1 Tax=Planosporangium thailandense TaxID=765197 RepID=A0ABX0XW40_9ACTN|nr:hypothetical protein [Planosporangium thailandense]NJC70259.1 hypothetical protein [Planosporangium thailandense]
MTTLSSATEDAEGAEQPGGSARSAQVSAAPGATVARRWPVDFAICAALTLIAVILDHGLLTNPTNRALALNPNDQALDEWLLALGPRFWTGDLHLVTHLLNAPDGINLLSNASSIVLGMILAPVTATLGAPVSFAVAVAGNLAATAIAWYLLLARTLRLHRAAAAVGAAACAFAPGMISQANAHLHITAQWLVPVIVWCVLRLARTPDTLPAGRQVRRIVTAGVLLGAIVCVQLFLGEEVLLLAAVTMALFCLAYAVIAPKHALRVAPPLTLGLVIGGVVGLAGLAYPLWVQFAGPQHVPNGPFSPDFFSADLRGFWLISPLSWFGSPDAARLVSGPAEYNTFFGIPLLLVTAGAAVWLRRRPEVLACVAAGLVMAALALGPHLVVNAVRTTHSGPYRLIQGLPVIDGALPTRFALALIPIIGIVLATALDRALRADRREVRLVVPAVVALALLPIAPKPLPVADRAPVPRFVTTGHWRDCVRPGGVLVPVPLPNPGNADKMRWPAAADDAFAIPEGFFIAPYAAGGQASIGIYSRPTSQLFNEVERSGAVPEITPDDQARARDDVAYWHASCLVVADHDQPHAAELRRTVEALFGPGRHVDDVTVWHFPTG